MGQNNSSGSRRDRPSIGDLYPNLSPEELAAAEKRLDDFLLIALRILKRLESDPEAYEAFCRLVEEEGTKKKADSPVLHKFDSSPGSVKRGHKLSQAASSVCTKNTD